MWTSSAGGSLEDLSFVDRRQRAHGSGQSCTGVQSHNRGLLNHGETVIEKLSRKLVASLSTQHEPYSAEVGHLKFASFARFNGVHSRAITKPRPPVSAHLASRLVPVRYFVFPPEGGSRLGRHEQPRNVPRLSKAQRWRSSTGDRRR